MYDGITKPYSLLEMRVNVHSGHLNKSNWYAEFTDHSRKDVDY